MSGFRSQLPTAVLQQALEKLVDEGAPSQLQRFIPATSFQGAKPGYYFSRGPTGLGYYLDGAQGEAAAAAAAADQGAGGEEDEEEPGPSSRAPARQLDPEELLREAEEAAGEGALQFVDSKGLKRLLLALERKYNANMELRMKYADQPDRFLESEVDLDEAVKNCMAVAGSPELYPELARSAAIPTLLALLNHENSDIAADVMELFQELTDGDVIEDSEEEAGVLVDALLEHNLLEMLVHRLTSFNEAVPDEASGVFAALGILENLIEVKPEVADVVTEKTKVLKWLLQRLKPRETDSNKQYASEILAILVQSSDTNKKKLAAMNGIDALLQAIAPYRNRDPATAEEEELVENLFDATCSALMLPENRTLFVQAEGVELMLLVLKSKRAARTAALKCLDFATTACPPAADRLVDQQGLKTLFAIFMGKLKVKRKDDSALQEEEERTVSIIASLLQGVSKASRRDRVAAKFVENEFEKCDRLMELFFRYRGRVGAEERRLARLVEEEEEELSEEELLLARMDAGLYTLQQCALIVGQLWMAGDLGVRKRVLMLLHQKGHALADVRGLLLEYRANLGDDGDGEAKAKLSQRVTQMLLALGHNPAEDEEAEKEAKSGAAAQQQQGAPEQPGGAAGRPGADADGDADMELEEGEERRPAAAQAPGEADMDLEGDEGRPAAAARGGKGREEGERSSPGRERERDDDRRDRRDRERQEERRDKDRDRERERDRRDSRGEWSDRDRERERGKEKRRREEEEGEERRDSERKRDRRGDDRRRESGRRDDDRRR